MARLVRIGFLALNVVVYGFFTLVLAFVGVDELIGHWGKPWKHLLLMPVGVFLCWFALLLLRIEFRIKRDTDRISIAE